MATIPPGTAAVGTGNPPVDMNNAAAVLAQLTGLAAGTTLPSWFTLARVAVAPSGDVTGVADAASIAAAVATLPASGGTVTLVSSAPWYIACGSLAISRSGVYLFAPGVTINAVGTGDVIRMYDTTNAWPVLGGGILGYPLIDGTSAGAGSSAVHMGDLLQASCEVLAKNFTGAGSIGVHFDNATYWTEQLRARVYAQNCNTSVVFDVTGAVTSTNSFARSDVQVYINQLTPSFNGVVFQNGAYLYDGAFGLRGNFAGSASVLTSAALPLTGTVPAGHPGAGAASGITASRVEIGAEIGSYAHAPTTIVFGSGSNKILGCYGVMDFSGGPGLFAAAASAAGIYPFGGTVTGDATLAAASGFSTKQTFLGQVAMQGTAGTNELLISAGGSLTESGAFVVQTGASGFAGIYDPGNSLYYGLSRATPGPAGTSTIGGYFKGLGVGGATNATATPIFGVLTSTQAGQGVGSTAFTVTDSNVVDTFHNVLDNGTTGGATTAGLSVFNGGTSTSGSAPVIIPTFAQNVASQLSDLTRDYTVYLNVTTAGTLTTLAIGPTSGVANVIKQSTTASIGDVYTVRLPAGWFLKWAGTNTLMATQLAVGC